MNHEPDITTTDAIKRISDQLNTKYETQELGHLVEKYHLDRDRQMATLTGLGKDVLLSLLSQGVPGPTIAEGLEIANDTFKEFIKLTCSKEEIKEARANAADALVAQGLKGLHAADDKDDLAQAKAIAEMNMKLAKTMSSDYVEKKPLTTAVQINNAYAAEEGLQSFVAFPQMTVPDETTLPDLPEHNHKAGQENDEHRFEPEGVIDGEFTLYDGED